jgi:phosphoribosylaminoimidazolecarboxamide formyltransferase / IMP cyclohydrolase
MSIRPVEKIDDLVRVKNVFCSVTNKDGLSDLIKGLIRISPEVNIFSTGGTFSHLQKELGETEASRHLTEVSQYTGMPETAGGLVKSLHHKLFLGYLTETHCEAHQTDMEREGAVAIDLVIVNLYDFKKAAINDGNPVTLELARGNIDVGGPSALRAAAKNWLRVMILPMADDYAGFLKSLEENGGSTAYDMRYRAAIRTFGILSSYDRAICDFFRAIPPEDTMKAYRFQDSQL